MLRPLGIAVLLFAAAGPAAADPDVELPLWELGAVLGAGVLPHYPASNQTRLEVLPLPYFAYRGEVLRSDDKGLLRGRLFLSENAELDISLAGAIATDSSDNRARIGMPDLDWMGEVGPRLEVTLARAARDAKIDLELPLRAVFSTNFSDIDYVGMVSVPEIAYQHDNLGGGGTRVKLGIGVTLADRSFQETLYGVADRYVTATRPAYRANGGYMGSRIQLSFSHRVTPALRVIGAVRADFHSGAANEDSPLFLRKTAGSLGLAVIWTMLRSTATVIE